MVVLVFSFLLNCSGKKIQQDEEIAGVPQKKIEPPKSLKERTMESSDGIIFWGKKDQSKVAFAADNVLWRATLKSLDFTPLNSSDYSGGVIVSDWYSPSESSGNSIKITVKFLSSRIDSSSIEVESYEKSCKVNSLNCTVKKSSNDFNLKIKEKILSVARQLSLQQDKNK